MTSIKSRQQNSNSASSSKTVDKNESPPVPDSTTEPSEKFTKGEGVFFHDDEGKLIFGEIGQINVQIKSCQILFLDGTQQWASFKRIKKVLFPPASSSPPQEENAKNETSPPIPYQNRPQQTCASCGVIRRISLKKSKLYEGKANEFQCRRCLKQQNSPSSSSSPPTPRTFLSKIPREISVLPLGPVLSPPSPQSISYKTNKSHNNESGVFIPRTISLSLLPPPCFSCLKGNILRSEKLHCYMCKRPCHLLCLDLSPQPLSGDLFWDILCSACGEQSKSGDERPSRIFTVRRNVKSWSDVAYLLLSCLTVSSPAQKYFHLDSHIIPFFENNLLSLHLPSTFKAALPEARQKFLLHHLRSGTHRFESMGNLWGLCRRESKAKEMSEFWKNSSNSSSTSTPQSGESSSSSSSDTSTSTTPPNEEKSLVEKMPNLIGLGETEVFLKTPISGSSHVAKVKEFDDQLERRAISFSTMKDKTSAQKRSFSESASGNKGPLLRPNPKKIKLHTSSTSSPIKKQSSSIVSSQTVAIKSSISAVSHKELDDSSEDVSDYLDDSDDKTEEVKRSKEEVVVPKTLPPLTQAKKAKKRGRPSASSLLLKTSKGTSGSSSLRLKKSRLFPKCSLPPDGGLDEGGDPTSRISTTLLEAAVFGSFRISVLPEEEVDLRKLSLFLRREGEEAEASFFLRRRESETRSETRRKAELFTQKRNLNDFDSYEVVAKRVDEDGLTRYQLIWKSPYDDDDESEIFDDSQNSIIEEPLKKLSNIVESSIKDSYSVTSNQVLQMPNTESETKSQNSSIIQNYPIKIPGTHEILKDEETSKTPMSIKNSLISVVKTLDVPISKSSTNQSCLNGPLFKNSEQKALLIPKIEPIDIDIKKYTRVTNSKNLGNGEENEIMFIDLVDSD